MVAAVQVRRGDVGDARNVYESDDRIPTLQTVGEAVDVLRQQIEKQVASARHLNVACNATAPGDAPVRAAFYTLLPTERQRQLFLELARRKDVWPRVRALFGAPPYDFLLPEDAAGLSARGFAARRAHMAFVDPQVAASYAKFGAGQLSDADAREYNVLRGHERAPVQETDPLLFDLQRVPAGSQLLLQVRVKRKLRRDRVAILRESKSAKEVNFPKPGERLELSPKPSVLRILGVAPTNERAAARTVQVKRVIPRGEACSTAAMIVTIL